MKCLLALPHFQVSNRKFLNVFGVCFLVSPERNKTVLLQEYILVPLLVKLPTWKIAETPSKLKIHENHFLRTFNFLIFLDRNLTNRSIEAHVDLCSQAPLGVLPFLSRSFLSVSVAPPSTCVVLISPGTYSMITKLMVSVHLNPVPKMDDSLNSKKWA